MVANNAVSKITVIPEQDPNGIFWGLRDTISNKLVLDYTYKKIWTLKMVSAIVMLNGKFGLINKNGSKLLNLITAILKHNYNVGSLLEFGYGPVIIFDTTGKSVMPMVYGMTGYYPVKNALLTDITSMECGILMEILFYHSNSHMHIYFLKACVQHLKQ